MSKAKSLSARTAVFRAAQMVTPRELRQEKFSYLQQYKCCPPPIGLLIFTLVEATSPSLLLIPLFFKG